MNNRKSPRSSFLSSILRMRSKRSAESQSLGRLQLFGMGGTFGHGVIRHCDTWELGGETPDRVTDRPGMGDIAERRREEASERLGRGKGKGFYDFINR